MVARMMKLTAMPRLLLASAMALMIVTPTRALAEEPAEAIPVIAFEQAGVYVLVDDLSAAKAFYAELLGLDPVFENPVFVGFYIEGGLFAVASRAQFAPDAMIGDRTVPYLRVKDIDAAFARVKAIAPEHLVSEEVIREGPIALIKLRDPEGNLIEFYSLSSAATNSSSD